MESTKSVKKWLFLSTVLAICIFGAYSCLSIFLFFVPKSRVISTYRNNSAVFEEAAIAILEDPDFTRLNIGSPIHDDYEHWNVDIDSVSPAVRQVAKSISSEKYIRILG